MQSLFYLRMNNIYMQSVSDFVFNGRIGQIRLGLSSKQVGDRLGEPMDWLGKKTIIGERHEFYNESNVWFYYEGSVGVRFGTDGIAEKIIIYPMNAAKCPDLFKMWPTISDLKMGQWREVLKANAISFRESNPQSLNYWIVAGDSCVTCCFPSLEETETKSDGFSRSIETLGKYANARAMLKDATFVT